MGWMFDEYWKDDWFVRLWLLFAVLLTALSKFLEKELESTEKIGRFSDSLLNRLRIQSACRWTCVCLWMSIGLTFIMIPLTSVGFYAAVAGLSISLATIMGTLKKFYPNEQEISVLMLATAMKFQCFETAATIPDAEEKWTNLREAPQPIQTEELKNRKGKLCWRVFLCLRPLPLGRKDPLENGRVGKAMVRDELRRSGILQDAIGAYLSRTLKQIRRQRQSKYYSTPVRRTSSGESGFAFTTVGRMLKCIHLCHNVGHERKPEETKMLVAAEFAARVDLPDLLGSMVSSVSKKSGLASDSDGWWCMGVEMISHLHLGLGINTVTEPKTVDCAKSMYRMLMSLDCVFMAKSLVEAVSERIIDQERLYNTKEESNGSLNVFGRLYTKDETAKTISEGVTSWLNNHGRLEKNELKQGVKTALHWMTFGLILLFGAKNAFKEDVENKKGQSEESGEVDEEHEGNGAVTGFLKLLQCTWKSINKKDTVGNKGDLTRARASNLTHLECLWISIKSVMNSAKTKHKEEAYCLERDDESPMIWYLPAKHWPRPELEKAIMEWTIQLMAREAYDNLKGIAKRADLLPAESESLWSIYDEAKYHDILRFADPENPIFHRSATTQSPGRVNSKKSSSTGNTESDHLHSSVESYGSLA